VVRVDDLTQLSRRLGEPGLDEIFIPEPYPFLGGSGELSTYAKGEIWIFARIVGQMQGVGA